MNLKLLVFTIISMLFLILGSNTAYAIFDPLLKPNNKMGIHILFTSELDDAAKLVNSSGGDWGYITIPIKASDKDIVKWQIFMDQAKKHHLIPILRLATDGDYFNTTVWHKPNEADILDFANFLNSLIWPIENKYVIVFNEVNRGNEWEGSPNPDEYAKLLNYAVTVFKSKNPNFFIISSGLDNAAPNVLGKYMDQFTYLRLMDNAVPGIFNQIDGLSSHSYPNPGFNQPPSVLSSKSITSFKYEKNYIETMTNKNLPVFITETGWSTSDLTDKQNASYFKQAFESVWNDPSIVTVTPFILNAGEGPFAQFSLIKKDGLKSERYKTIQNIPKTKGEPILTNIKSVLGKSIFKDILPTKNFSEHKSIDDITADSKGNATKTFLKWLLNVR